MNLGIFEMENIFFWLNSLKIIVFFCILLSCILVMRCFYDFKNFFFFFDIIVCFSLVFWIVLLNIYDNFYC